VTAMCATEDWTAPMKRPPSPRCLLS